MMEKLFGLADKVPGQAWMAIFFLFVAVIAFAAWRMMRNARHMLEESGQRGSVRGVAVDIFPDSTGRRSAAITVIVGDDGVPVRLYLGTAQAKQLAEMLRLASAPGRNLAQARFNVRRSGAAKAG